MIDLSKNYFELFGLPVSFRVDGQALSSRYRDLQRVVHPDKFSSAPSHEQRVALQQATQVNEAFETLKDPLKRAQYLLSLYGMEESGSTTQDKAFLMEQLQLREELANARNAPEPLSVVDDLMGRISAMIKRLVAQMAIQFETRTTEQLAEARESVRKMQFLNKLHREAENLEAELEDNL